MNIPLTKTFVTITTLFVAAGLSQAATITVVGAANTSDSAKQGSVSGGGTLSDSILVGNNTVSGQPQQFIITGLNLNGSADDSVVINFTVTTAGVGSTIQTSETTSTGWLAGGSGNTMKTDGENLKISLASISVNIDGGTGNGIGTFKGFTGVKMGNWQALGADIATINGEQFTSVAAAETLVLTDQTSDSMEFTFTAADGDLGDWRPLGTNFSIEASAIPEPSSMALLGLGGLALILRRCK